MSFFERFWEQSIFSQTAHLEVAEFCFSNCQAKLRTLVWAHNMTFQVSFLSVTAYSMCIQVVLTLVIKFFYVTFQNSPLFSDAIGKLLSDSLTGKVPYTLSTQFPSILFNIRNNLQVARDERKDQYLKNDLRHSDKNHQTDGQRRVSTPFLCCMCNINDVVLNINVLRKNN